MIRAGHSSKKAELIYQHSDDERQGEVAARPRRHKRPGSLTWTFFMERVTS
ncbi:hypothetical protein [Streptomyces sp. NPDC001165]|uniref:hypothetical protein n=1 Tax=Streptomyces sp. NPDC001165 TaxID=3364546 RepID=UPI0036AB6E53